MAKQLAEALKLVLLCPGVHMVKRAVVSPKFLHTLQLKRYPRNWCVEMGKEQCYGRLRIQLKKEDGTPVNPEVPNSRWPAASRSLLLS